MSQPPKSRLNKAILQRILQFARPEWGRLAVASVFLAVGSLASLLIPLQIRRIIDEQLSRSVVDRAALGIVLLSAVQGVAVAMRSYLFNTSGERTVTRLRNELFGSLLRQEVAFFDERRTGELTSRLGSDNTVLQSAVSANISMLLRNIATVLGGVGFLFYTSPILTLLMLGIVPPVAIGAVVYGRRVRKLSREVQDSLARSNEVAEESLSGIRTVRAFAAEPAEGRRYQAAVDQSYELAKHRGKLASLFMGGASTAAYLSAAAVLWYGGRLVMEGSLSRGGLFAFLFYSLFVAFSFAALSDLWADLMRASGAAERVFELIDRVPAMPSSGGRRLEKVQGDLSFAGVVFAYPTRKDVPVLRGIDLEIKRGEIIALVGPSGAGKSTVAALLTRLYDPLEGRLSLDGVDLRELDPSWLRQQVGVVS